MMSIGKGLLPRWLTAYARTFIILLNEKKRIKNYIFNAWIGFFFYSANKVATNYTETSRRKT